MSIHNSQAQDRPRVGIGVESMWNLFSDTFSEDALAIGLRTRISYQINYDVSVAGGIGVAGFLADGSSNAVFLINPQLSIIASLHGESRYPYFLAGVGGMYPTMGREGGWSFHAGYGMIFALTDSALFLELDPTFVVLDEKTILMLPLRFGVVF